MLCDKNKFEGEIDRYIGMKDRFTVLSISLDGYKRISDAKGSMAADDFFWEVYRVLNEFMPFVIKYFRYRENACLMLSVSLQEYEVKAAAAVLKEKLANIKCVYGCRDWAMGVSHCSKFSMSSKELIRDAAKRHYEVSYGGGLRVMEMYLKSDSVFLMDGREGI